LETPPRTTAVDQLSESAAAGDQPAGVAGWFSMPGRAAAAHRARIARCSRAGGWIPMQMAFALRARRGIGRGAYGIKPNLLFRWRKMAQEDAKPSAAPGVPSGFS